MSGAAVVESGADASTWIFLGSLAAATAGVLAFYGRAIAGWHPPGPRPDLVSPGHFVRMRGPEQEVDLGTGWRATDDPGAAWHLWWTPRTGEIVGLRYAALPPPPGPAHLGSYHGRTLLDPVGVHHFTGMRILGYSDDRPSRLRCEALRPCPDGLDHLTGGTHQPVLVAPDRLGDETGRATDAGGDPAT